MTSSLNMTVDRQQTGGKDQLLALVVDDERNMRFMLQETLSRAGFAVTSAASGEEALDLLHDTHFGLAILDLRLGGRVDGMRLLQAARWRWSDMAIIILTAHGSLETAVESIKEGVDGYLLKPVERQELLRTVKQALDRRKRLVQSNKPEPRVFEHGPLRIDLDKHLVLQDEEMIELSPQEFALLVCLFENRERVVSPKELAKVVRDFTPDSTYEARQIIKWYIHRLRHKIEKDPRNPQFVVNVRGVGYTLGILP